jgi:hypothetical protein
MTAIAEWSHFGVQACGFCWGDRRPVPQTEAICRGRLLPVLEVSASICLVVCGIGFIGEEGCVEEIWSLQAVVGYFSG